MNRKILVFVAFGSLGDVYPLLAVAAKLKLKQRVVFLANEYFRDHIESQGVSFHPIGTVDDQLVAKESKESTGETKAGRVHRFEHIIGKSFSPTFNYIKELVEGGEQVVVVSHGNLSPAVLACEAFNVPLIITHYAPSQIPNNIEDMIMFESFYGNKNEWLLRHVTLPFRSFIRRARFDVKDSYNNYRISHGLRPLPGFLAMLWNTLTFSKKSSRVGAFTPLEIALIPTWFADPLDQKFPNIKFVGFPFVEGGEWSKGEGLEAFLAANPKPIVFTPGTAVEDLQEFCEQIVPICRKLGSPGILASKHGKAFFDSINNAVDVPLFYLEHADFSTLLPFSRCLIHHGGIGTAAEAIRAGIPQIIRPRMYDQSPNALRVMMFGLGGCVAPSSYNADQVTDMLLHIEASQHHQNCLAYYADLVRNESGVDCCCEIIANYLEENVYANESVAESLEVY